MCRLLLTYAHGTAQHTHDTTVQLSKYFYIALDILLDIPTSSRGERFVIGVCFVTMFGESLPA